MTALRIALWLVAASLGSVVMMHALPYAAWVVIVWLVAIGWI